ncbi:hypothetical protein [Pontimicrobium sp. MEBiC06410]
MSSLWKYATEAHATEALEYYENLLMRSIDVFYVAVVKKSCDNECYGLEIGIMSNYENVHIDKFITQERAFNHDFPQNSIPEYLPIPSIYSKGSEYVSQNILTDKEFKNLFSNTRSTVQTELVTFDGIDINIDPNKQEEILLEEKDWYSYDYGRQPIKTLNGCTGTLGGFFELDEFPNSLFGISNWHILTVERDLGVSVYSNNGEKIGEAFWQQLNIYSESAFLKFTPEVSKKLKCKYKNSLWSLGTPKIGDMVFHKGYGSYRINNLLNKRSKIHSNNATIKTYCDAFENNMRIFKNQLLIKNFSEDGDSGALVITEREGEIKKTAVGLLFAVRNSKPINSSEYTSISVANNLNFIFNKRFHEKQEVFIEITENLKKTYLTNQFTLSKNTFY